MGVPAASPGSEVRAAGGVVWRPNDGGAVEVLVIHRPRYDDWSLPKGKVDPGESDLEAARREVTEETGLRCEVGTELPTVRYVDRHRRPKRVRYWAMTVVDGAFTPNGEVDQICWLTPDETSARLTYAHDRPVVAALVTG
jgi:8-oxo-dGTP diphosphatase